MVKWGTALLAACMTALGAAVPTAALDSHPRTSIPAYEWPTLNANNARTGFNGLQAILTPANAASLHQTWSNSGSGSIVDEPVVANGLIYYGSQHGDVSALDLNGSLVWTTFVGQTTSTCPTGGTASAGAANTPTVLNPGPGSSVVVAGGDGFMYSLDAFTGAVRWRTQLAVAPAGFLWSSPAVFNGSVYEGIASLQDCPLVRGGVARLDLTTGLVQNVNWMAPKGCLGATIWSSPAIDEATGLVYLTTGNPGTCAQAETAAQAIVAVRASDLVTVDSWQIPPTEPTCPDCDFGATPILFSATIGGRQTFLVGAANKNGVYYALDRTNLAAGPLWKRTIARAGEDPLNGDGSISGSAFDGFNLYVAGGATTVSGKSCKGSVRSVDPSSGIPHWVDCAPFPILASLSATPGVVIASAGPFFGVVSSSTGAVLFSYKNTNAQSAFLGGTSISEGVLYMGGGDGVLRAFATA